jgi:putative redox protein
VANVEEQVSTRPGHHYTVDIDIRQHHLVGDESLESDGDDLGPGPFELMLSALGSCTAMTLKFYAIRRGIPQDNANIHLTFHEKVLPRDEAAGRSQRAYAIRQEITLHGNLSTAQRADLLRVAKKCPVHKFLESVPEFEELLVPTFDQIESTND